MFFRFIDHAFAAMLLTALAAVPVQSRYRRPRGSLLSCPKDACTIEICPDPYLVSIGCDTCPNDGVFRPSCFPISGDLSDDAFIAQCDCCPGKCEDYVPCDKVLYDAGSYDIYDEDYEDCQDRDHCIYDGNPVLCSSPPLIPPDGGAPFYTPYVEPVYDTSNCASLLACTAQAVQAPAIEEKSGGSGGDPHFKTWSGHWYDFHASCDLVLLHAPSFPEGLDIHIRTTGRYTYSFISSVAVKIGAHSIFQVDSWGGYSLDSISAAELPSTLGTSGFVVTHKKIDEKKSLFDIYNENENNGAHITLSVFKDLVAVDVSVGTDDSFFADSVGLMGSFENGTMLARDATTVFTNDPNTLGQEWQVHPEEDGMLFMSAVSPQYPQACVFPDATTRSDRRRRLGATIAQAAAEEACASRWGDDEERKALCVFDVMATGDIEVAQAGAF